MNKTTISGIQPIEVSERRPLIPGTKPVIILYQQQEGFGMELEVEQDQIGPLMEALAAIAKATTTNKEKTHTCGACGEPCFPSGPARGCSCD